MRFINPKTDLAFKKIFGSDASHEILIDFLDSLLYASRGIIADLEIIIQHARDLTAIPTEFANVAPLRCAFDLANTAQLTQEEEEELEKREIFIHDQRNAIIKAMKQGIEQGIEQGVQAEKIAIARNLLDVLDDATISAKTGMAEEDAASLRGNSG